MVMKMTGTLSRVFAAPVEEKAMIKQGIVAILNSDGGGRSEGSIRRTLSADMSSKKWLEQNGMMKKVVSSQELMKLPVSVSDSSDEEEEEEKQKPAALEDVWSSIMMSKKENDTPLAAYVHPLVKRSSSALSEQSLKICTESLGSETGSDCFSVDEDKDWDDRALEEELKEVEVEDQFEDFIPQYRKSPATLSQAPLPPPIHSISGASIHMNSRRENGRLVVEAVSVPPRNFFQAQRCDGRLVLSLICISPSASETAEESDGAAEFEEPTDEEIFDGSDGDDGYEDEEQTFQMEPPPKSGVMMTKFIGIGDRNPKADKTTIATAADMAVEEEEKKVTVAQSLPPPPPPRVPRLIPRPPTPTPAAAASFNSYDYPLRNLTAVPVGGFISKGRLNDVKSDGVKGTANIAEYLALHLRGCKEGRRSQFIWEPYCIAT